MPILHTTNVLAPNDLNTHIIGDEGCWSTFSINIPKGGPFPILVNYLATLQNFLDPPHGFFKHLMISCKTITHPRPASDPGRLCWGTQANSEPHTCSQHPAFPSSTLQRVLHRIRCGLLLNRSSSVVLLSPLLFAPSVGALEPGCVSPHDRVSWAQALRSTQTDLISVSHSSLLPPSKAH